MSYSPVVWRSSPKEHCPICDGNHACSRTEDGLHFCRRRKGDLPGWKFLGPDSIGFGMYREADTFRETVDRRGNPIKSKPAPTPSAPTPKRSPEEWGRLCEMMRQAREREPGRLADLALSLSLPPDTLDAVCFGFLPVCDVNKVDCPASPEYDADGHVVGILRRIRGGENKYRVKGSQSGLCYPKDWTPPESGLLAIVEGATDVAALLAAGVPAIGRPTNTPGRRGTPWLCWLADMLRRLPEGVEPIVMGENDARPDKDKPGETLWPGRDGAVATARGLSHLLGRQVRWCMPPEGVKDARVWYVELVTEGKDAGAVIRRWLEENGRPEGEPATEATGTGAPTAAPVVVPPVPGPRFSLDLPDPPPAAACPCGTTKLLETAPEEVEACRLSCKRMRCPVCMRRRVHEKLTKAERGMNEALANGCSLALGVFEGVTANNIQKRMKAAGYVSVAAGDRLLFVCALSPGMKTPKGFEVETHEKIRTELLAAVADLESPSPFCEVKRWRPVNLSQSWSRPEVPQAERPDGRLSLLVDEQGSPVLETKSAEKPRQPQKHVIASIAASEPEQILRVLAAFGLDPAVHRPPPWSHSRLGWSIRFSIAHLDGRRRMELFDRLGALPACPPSPSEREEERL